VISIVIGFGLAAGRVASYLYGSLAKSKLRTSL